MSAAALQWVVAGGGTGGHVTPALALAERIRDEGDRVTLFGSVHGIETRLVPAAGFELVALPSRQLMGRGVLQRAVALCLLGLACLRAWRELGRRRADFVLSVGGYASLPAVLGAALRRIPIGLLEPNAVPGRANRLAARFAALVFVQFEPAARALGSTGRREPLQLGIPLRAALLAAFGEPAPRRSPVAPIRLLVLGGSQGAHSINRALCELAPRLAQAGLEIFHQSGAADRAEVEAAYRAAGVRAHVVDFEHDMPARYAWADLALCRAGALTLAELAQAGLPALLAPYPFAADDHQRANARAYAARGAARVLESRPLEAAEVFAALQELLAAPERLLAMGRSAAACARPRAAQEIVAACRGAIDASREAA